MFLPRVFIPITCDPATSTCTATGYQFQGNETVNFQSTGTPPAGIYTLSDTYEPVYAVCEVQGSSFRLHQNNCAGALQTFGDAGSGTQGLLINTQNVFYTAVSGTPVGTIWGLTSQYNTVLPAQSSVPYDQGEGDILELRIPANATPGDYQVSVTVALDALGNNASTLTWTITVLAPPAAPTGPQPTTFPPIPGLSGWQTQMISPNLGGAQWCSNPANPTEVFNFGNESQVWYYDGARVYFQIADYTGNTAWRNCGHNIASQYADYVIRNNGGIPGWRFFALGLARAAVLYPSETKFKQAVDMLAAAQYASFGGYPDDVFLRETAYAVDTYTTAESVLHEPRNPHLQRSAEFLMGMLLSYTDGTGRYSQSQTFFNGLAMEALINYWNLTADPRVPYVVQRMLDNIWSNYDQVNHVIMYDPDPPGPHCESSPLWFDPSPTGNCAVHNGQNLQDLVAPGFAWYWKITGNDTYRQRGDDLFQHCLDGTQIYSGKQFSQIYRWSFDFAAYRGAPRPVRGR